MQVELTQPIVESFTLAPDGRILPNYDYSKMTTVKNDHGNNDYDNTYSLLSIMTTVKMTTYLHV